jgi:hypothetical protein
MDTSIDMQTILNQVNWLLELNGKDLGLAVISLISLWYGSKFAIRGTKAIAGLTTGFAGNLISRILPNKIVSGYALATSLIVGGLGLGGFGQAESSLNNQDVLKSYLKAVAINYDANKDGVVEKAVSLKEMKEWLSMMKEPSPITYPMANGLFFSGLGMTFCGLFFGMRTMAKDKSVRDATA